MRKIQGKVAWITGAGSGMGKAAAVALAPHGVPVVLSGRRLDRLQKTAEEVQQAGGEAMVAQLDVTDSGAVAEVATAILKRFGRVDILVNSAGINIKKRFWSDAEPEGFDKVMAINVNGSFYCAKAVLPTMRAQREGLIVNVSSWAGRYHSRVSGPAYNASKAALVWLNENLNLEEGENGIRACALNPGEVATEILDARVVPVPQSERDKMLQADDIGEIILFLATLPSHVCINELTVSPVWNRAYIKAVSATTDNP